MESPAELWNRHLLCAEEGRQFVDVKLLDEVRGKATHDKFTDMQKYLSEMLVGTGVQVG